MMFRYRAENPIKGQLTLESVNRGRIVFDDGIDGENYNIDVFGDGTGYVKFNNAVENVNRFAMNGGAVVHLGLNGRIYAQDFVSGSSSVYARTGAQKPLLTVDVMVDRENNTVHSGAIHVNGRRCRRNQRTGQRFEPRRARQQKRRRRAFPFRPQRQ